MPETVPALHIDVYADVVCPWCWIGERRLLRAIGDRTDLDVTLSWRPFQLDPTTPPEGRDWQQIIEQKFGGNTRAKEMFGHVAQAGKTDGIEFRFDRITTSPNTVRAHSLLLHAQQSGVQWPLVESLYQAHFRDGLDIGNADTLREIGIIHGLDGVEIDEIFASGRYGIDIQQSQREASRLGVRGVPFVVVDNRIGISGAQPESVFRQAIDQALLQAAE